MRTFADWNQPPPGFLEIDLVAHCGDNMGGSFVYSLVATDVCTGWTEAVPLLAREQSLVVTGLKAIAKQLPFPVLGIDSDNDSVFINDTLTEYCADRRIEFTRSRAYRNVSSNIKMCKSSKLELTHLRMVASSADFLRRCTGQIAKGGTSERDIRVERRWPFDAGDCQGAGRFPEHGAPVSEIAGGDEAEGAATKRVEPGSVHRAR